MKKTEFIFPVLVLATSVSNIMDFSIFDNIPSLIISIIGIIGVILFLIKKSQFHIFLYIWIASQLIIIPGLWDVTQSLKFSFGLSLTLKSGSESGVYLNILPVFYFIGFRVLQMSTIIGAKIKLKKFNKESRLNDLLPVSGVVLKRVNLSGEREWLLVELEKPFLLADNEVRHVFLRAKNEKPLQKSKNKQMAYFNAGNVPPDINNDKFLKENYKFIDWVMVDTE